MVGQRQASSREGGVEGCRSRGFQTSSGGGGVLNGSGEVTGWSLPGSGSGMRNTLSGSTAFDQHTATTFSCESCLHR
jgi:hypothetical protein